MPSSRGSVLIKSVNAEEPDSLPLARIAREPVSAEGEVRLWLDAAHRDCFSGYGNPMAPGNPLNAQNVKDIAKGLNVPWDIKGGQSVIYSGNGWSFENATGAAGDFPASLVIPGGPSTSIWGDGTQSQYWGMVLHVRLPADADWNPRTTTLPFMAMHGSAGTQFTEAGLGMIGALTNVVKQLRFNRFINLAARDALTLNVPAGAPGKFAQIAGWRDADGVHFSLRYDDGTATGAVVRATTVTGTGNATVSFAGKQGRVGAFTHFAPVGPGGAEIPPSAYKWKLYAVGIENLRDSGRDFEAVLAADWAYRLKMKNAGIYA